VGPNPFLGVIFHWIGGFCSATNFIPFRGIKRWSWEIYWLIQGVAAWLIAPTVLALVFVPDVFAILHASAGPTIFYTCLWGALWGIGGLTFGLAIRYLGIGLGYSIALGFCAAVGTLVPPIRHGQLLSIASTSSGRVILLGVAVCVIGIAVNGAAGYNKEREMTESEKDLAGEHDYSFVKGILVAVFAGIMSACFAVGLDYGKPIADLAKSHLLAQGRADLWQNLPVLIIVLWGGFATNLIWSVILILKNGSAAQFLGSPGFNPMGATRTTGNTLMDLDPTNLDPTTLISRIAPLPLLRNYILAAMAGIIWYFQFFFYSMGQTKMGKYDFSSWTLHMASIIIFAALWGITLREWRGTSLKTRLLVTAGILLLISSTIIVGYGNYLGTR
jgi:L-rhamnose-H+ transport protein